MMNRFHSLWKQYFAAVPDDEAAIFNKRLGLGEQIKLGKTYQESIQYLTLFKISENASLGRTERER